VIDHEQFLAQAASYARTRHEITNIVWTMQRRAPKASFTRRQTFAEAGSTPTTRPASLPNRRQGTAPKALHRGKHNATACYSLRSSIRSAPSVLLKRSRCLPTARAQAFTGALIAEYRSKADAAQCAKGVEPTPHVLDRHEKALARYWSCRCTARIG